MDTLKSQIKPRQNLNVVLSELFIQILKFRFGLQLPLIVLWTLTVKYGVCKIAIINYAHNDVKHVNLQQPCTASITFTVLYRQRETETTDARTPTDFIYLFYLYYIIFYLFTYFN